MLKMDKQAHLTKRLQMFWSDFKVIYLAALILRIFLLFYGQWHDLTMEIKFTDVDYFVFTDASEFVTLGLSPYLRGTYRYSPILAWILTPNIYFFESWGKILFITCDLTSAFLMQIILTAKTPPHLVKLAVAFWLFNPITAAVSCRGNAESVMSLLVLFMLHFLKQNRTCPAGVMFGLAVHLKIYPVVYSLAIYLYLDSENGNCLKRALQSILKGHVINGIKCLFSRKKVTFILSAGATFLLLTVTMYQMYGHDFFEHTYLYHVRRKDIRHNFSVYFYLLYLNTSSTFGILSFIVQFLVILVLSVMFYRNIELCLFLLTYAFVTFNKICTSQYFLWYVSLAPLVVKDLAKVPLKNIAFVFLLWLFGQGIWLAFAGQLEFLGTNCFVHVWFAGCLFFIINCFMICLCLRYCSFSSFVEKYEKSSLKEKQKSL